MRRQPTRERRWLRILGRMQADAVLLKRYGVLIPKAGRKSPAWCVCYNDYSEGRRVQRAIYVGIDPVLVRRTRRWLEEHQQLDRRKREIDKALRSLKRIVSLLRYPHRVRRKVARTHQPEALQSFAN
jgi:hypothetical protein